MVASLVSPTPMENCYEVNRSENVGDPGPDEKCGSSILSTEESTTRGNGLSSSDADITTEGLNSPGGCVLTRDRNVHLISYTYRIKSRSK